MGGYYVPTVQPTLSALFDYYAGDIQTVLYTASKPELEKAYVLGLKVAALIGVWFAALFVVELLIRLVMLIVVYLLRTVGILSKPKMGADGDDICVEEKAISEGTHEKFE